MKLRAFVMLGLAALLGVVAVYLARGWIDSQKRVAVSEDKINLTTVVIAKRPLKLGDELTREFLQEVPWPANAVPQDSFRKMDELVRSGSEARVALRSIQVNEPILKSKITGFGGRATLSTLMDKDMRGFTIRVNDVIGVAGFIMPGDHVDVLLTRTRGKDDHITDVLMQNVKVLGIDQQASDDKDKPNVVKAVTLEVTTDQGQKLALASTVGALTLALRHSLNTGEIAHRTIRERDLVDDMLVRKTEPAKPAAAPAIVKSNPYTSVKVVRGVTATTQEVVIESPGAARRSVATMPRKLEPGAPDAARSADAPKPEKKPAARPEKPAPDSPARATPSAPGQPVPLWRDKNDKTVQGAGAGEKSVSALSPHTGL